MDRRNFLKAGALGLSAGSFGVGCASKNLGPSKSALPHFEPKAKSIIYLCQSGGPSHIDLFDYHPEMKKLHGTELPDSVRNGQRVTGMTANQAKFPVCAPIKDFKQYGQSGTWVSDFLPYTSQIVDDITVIKSMHTEAINHDPGITFLNTGSQIPGRPSLGAWLSHGLGSENPNMPGYNILISQGNGKKPARNLRCCRSCRGALYGI